MALRSPSDWIEVGHPPGARCSRSVFGSPPTPGLQPPRPPLQFCYVPDFLIEQSINLVDEFVARFSNPKDGALLGGLR